MREDCLGVSSTVDGFHDHSALDASSKGLPLRTRIPPFGMISITDASLPSAPGAYLRMPKGLFLKVASAVAPVASAAVDVLAPLVSGSAYPVS